MVRRWNLLVWLALFGVARSAWSADSLIFVPLTPCRVIDTRLTGAGGALAGGTQRTFFFRGPTRNYATTPNQGGNASGCGIPDLGVVGADQQNIAQAVAINIIAVTPAGAGDLRAWPADQGVPLASVLNYAAVPGLSIANGVIVPMCTAVSGTPCAAGDITFQADVSATHLVVDVVGYFHAGSATNLLNTALGHQALRANTTGIANSATGSFALSANSTGSYNTASGFEALGSNTMGSRNTASGAGALAANTTGSMNTVSGEGALAANTAGGNNTAIGAGALHVSTGSLNTAIGSAALYDNTTGNQNTAVGINALTTDTTGYRNIALGYNAGASVTTGNYNIDIGNRGVAGDGLTIRIGTPGTHAATFIAGIRGTTTSLAPAIPVLIDANGQLGTVSSSIRFKEDVHDLGSAADRILQLRPVSFRYKKAFANGEKPVQYGLIAEEVEKVFPELVVHGKDGQPETVKYQDLPTLLLNELEKEDRQLQELRHQLAEKDVQIADLRREKDEGLAGLLARVEALEMQMRPEPGLLPPERPRPERR